MGFPMALVPPAGGGGRVTPRVSGLCLIGEATGVYCCEDSKYGASSFSRAAGALGPLRVRARSSGDDVCGSRGMGMSSRGGPVGSRS
jgi:hypothetical protein